MATFQLTKVKSGGGGLSIGDHTSTSRSTLVAGNVLLPLGVVPRILTAAEISSYPLLNAQLPDLPAYTQQPSAVGTNSIVIGTDVAKEYGVYADGSKFYFGDDGALKRYDRATDTATLLFFTASADDIKGVACSADGVIVAFIQWDDSTAQHILQVSNDSGATFTVHAETAGSLIGDSCSVQVSPDGSTIVATVPTGANDIQYKRIDNPAGSLALDVDTEITVNLPVTGSLTGNHTSSFSDDGLTFAISYTRADIVDEYISAYTEDAGASFTRINAYPLDVAQPVAGNDQIIWRILVDPVNPQRLVLLGAGLSNVSHFYSPDKGITWSAIFPPSIQQFSVDTVTTGNGWRDSSQWKPKFRNGILYAYLVDDRAVLMSITPTGEVTHLQNMTVIPNVISYVDIGWSADEQSFGVVYTEQTQDYPYTGGIMTIGKHLPAAQPNANIKIVADAP